MEKRLPESSCLNCGERLYAARAFDHEKATPEPGDMTLCITCGHLMAFSEDLHLRELTDAERVQIAGYPQLLAAQRALVAIKRMRKG